ncbi:MAG: fumarylacetoacetate hydrolase family protein, partial [Pseudonocardia sp.]|nr:fumarylacetoacetate hydrolase family protein [Pseudonocardia sp.]
NGSPRQASSTADMIFDVAHLVWELSRYMVFEPGDLINNGTPEGVALSGAFLYLAAGDVVEFEIDRLGRQRQVIKADRAPSPIRSIPERGQEHHQPVLRELPRRRRMGEEADLKRKHSLAVHTPAVLPPHPATGRRSQLGLACSSTRSPPPR